MYKKRAFSLIELMVSLSIIAILTVLFLVNYRSANRRTDLTMTAQILVTDIRYAQSNALGLVQYEGLMPEGGWGVYFSSADSANDQYIIFADDNDNERYDQGEANPAFGGRVVKLPKNIIIDQVRLGSATYTDANVTFLPPDPTTRLRSGSHTSYELEIVLKETADNNTETIRVNFLGLIEVID